MGIKKGSTRLTWVISLIPGVGGLCLLLLRLIQQIGINIFPGYGMDFVEIGILWLCGSLGIWLIYWSIRFIVGGFVSSDSDHPERNNGGMDKAKLHNGYAGSQSASEDTSVPGGISQNSGENLNQLIPSNQPRDHGSITKKRRTIVSLGSSIVIFLVIIFGAKLLGRQVGRQRAIDDFRQECNYQNAPTGIMGVTWLMSKSQVKSMFPDAIELVQDDLILDSTAFSRAAFIDYVFRDNLLVMIIITFKGEKSESTYRSTHNLVIREYGEFPEPSSINGFILTSKKSIGTISIEHNYYRLSGLLIEQVMLYKRKNDSFVSIPNNRPSSYNPPLASLDSIQPQITTMNISGITGLKRLLDETEKPNRAQKSTHGSLDAKSNNNTPLAPQDSIQPQSPVTKGIVGMSKSEVLNLLGEPEHISTWAISGSQFELWSYWGGYGELYIKNNYVEGWSHR